MKQWVREKLNSVVTTRKPVISSLVVRLPHRPPQVKRLEKPVQLLLLTDQQRKAAHREAREWGETQLRQYRSN